MNVLIVSQYYYPEQFLINDIAEEMVIQGHKVTVLTGLPNYPKGEIFPEYKNYNKKYEIINGVKVIRCKIISRGTNKIRLLLNYLSYLLSASIKAMTLRDKFDVVYAYQMTPVFQVVPAIIYKKLHGIKLFCYCLDLAPASGEDMFGNHKILMSLYKNISKWIYDKCDQIGVTSPHFIKYLRRVHKIEMKKMVYLPQHASEQLLTLNISSHINHTIKTLMFAGNLGLGASLETIIYAAKLLKDSGEDRFRIRFLGDGSAKEGMQNLTKKLKLTDIIYFDGQVPMEEMPSKYSETDALLVTLRKGQLTIPGKLQAYMATSLPIIGAMDGSGKMLINKINCGICVDAEDSEALASAICDYLNNTKKYEDMGKIGRLYFKRHFTKEKHIADLTNQLEGLLQIIGG